MSHSSETPFDNIESSHEYVTLLAEAIDVALAELEADLALAGIASEYWNPRPIGAIAGVLSSSTALFWGWAHFTGRLPEPERLGIDPEEIEVHPEPAA